MSPLSLSNLSSAIVSQGTEGVKVIAIGDKNMGDEGLISFCAPLYAVNGGPLEEIDFSFKGISTDGAQAIGRAFGGSQNLRQITLYRNFDICDKGLAALCNAANDIDSSGIPFPALNFLDLSECSLGEKGIKCLVESLLGAEKKPSERQNLINLILNQNEIGSIACDHLTRMFWIPHVGKSYLQSLSLKNCTIGDKGVSKLFRSRRCDGLRKLDLTGNGITMNGIVEIAAAFSGSSANFKDLRELHLSHNPIGQDGTKLLTESLRKWSSMKRDNSTILDVLDLSDTHCGQEGAISVLQCGSFETVRLFNNNLGSVGFEALASIVKDEHPSIINLDVGGNRASETAVSSFLRALMVKHQPDNSVLRTLEIGGNAVGKEVESIVARLKEICPELDVAKDHMNNQYPQSK